METFWLLVGYTAKHEIPLHPSGFLNCCTRAAKGVGTGIPKN
jgi:hypothetical protein